MANILFVDDEALTLRLLTQAADIAGHTALTSRSLAEALVVAQRDLPDMVFVDLNLGDGTGLELAEQLTSNPETVHIPVILLSADNSLDVQERALKSGAERYLPKPIKIQTLIEVIREYTGER
jgi:two-component system cell cycle response regulator